MGRSAQEGVATSGPKRGDVGQDGRVFWERNKAFPSGEYWVTRETYDRLLEAKKASRRRYYLRHAEALKRKSRERHESIKHSAEFRERKAKYRKENAPRLRKREAAWRKEKALRCPEVRVFAALRARVKAAVRTGGSSRSQDREAVRFLVWLAGRLGVDYTDGKAWHVDHIVPISKCKDLSKANAPENLRWLPARENVLRKDADASPEEVEAHLNLVAEWRNLGES